MTMEITSIKIELKKVDKEYDKAWETCEKVWQKMEHLKYKLYGAKRRKRRRSAIERHLNKPLM